MEIFGFPFQASFEPNYTDLIITFIFTDTKKIRHMFLCVLFGNKKTGSPNACFLLLCIFLGGSMCKKHKKSG